MVVMKHQIKICHLSFKLYLLGFTELMAMTGLGTRHVLKQQGSSLDIYISLYIYTIYIHTLHIYPYIYTYYIYIYGFIF